MHDNFEVGLVVSLINIVDLLIQVYSLRKLACDMCINLMGTQEVIMKTLKKWLISVLFVYKFRNQKTIYRVKL